MSVHLIAMEDSSKQCVDAPQPMLIGLDDTATDVARNRVLAFPVKLTIIRGGKHVNKETPFRRGSVGTQTKKLGTHLGIPSISLCTQTKKLGIQTNASKTFQHSDQETSTFFASHHNDNHQQHHIVQHSGLERCKRRSLDS